MIQRFALSKVEVTDASGLAIPSWDNVVGTLMNGMFWRDALSFAASILVPPPTPMRTRVFHFFMRSSTVRISLLVTVLTRRMSTFMPACWRRSRTFFPAILQLFCPATIKAEPLKLSLCTTSVTHARVPFPTMTSRGSCM